MTSRSPKAKAGAPVRLVTVRDPPPKLAALPEPVMLIILLVGVRFLFTGIRRLPDSPTAPLAVTFCSRQMLAPLLTLKLTNGIGSVAPAMTLPAPVKVYISAPGLINVPLLVKLPWKIQAPVCELVTVALIPA